MTVPDHNAEYQIRFAERLAVICDQRPATERDRAQAKREAIEDLERLEKAELCQ